MTPLSDAQVAKALGWKLEYTTSKWWKPGDSTYYNARHYLPHFTTSLDCIVAEIEAMGIRSWHVVKQAWTKDYYEAVIKIKCGPDYVASGRYETAPLALCAALLSFLKESKP